MSERVSWINLTELRDFDRFGVDIREEPAAPNELSITLATGPNITWWKSIKLSDRLTGNRIVEEETHDADHGPRSITVNVAQVDSAKLVLCKAKFLGIHTEMYEVYELREMLGRRVSLTWRTDAADNVWAALGSFFSEVVTFVERALSTVVGAVVTAVETVVGVIVNAVAWVVGLILAIPILGRAIAFLWGILTAIVGFIVNVIMEALYALLGIVGVKSPMKLMRLVVVIQEDELGTPVATIDEVRVQLDFMIKLFQERANIRVIPGGPFKFSSKFDSVPVPAEEFIVSQNRPSMSQTLDVRCDGEGFADDFGSVGASFQIMVNNLFWGNSRRLIGAGPLVAFAVRRYNPSGTVGCSMGPTSQYVTTMFRNSMYSNLAHEVVHSCALRHFEGGTTNLMLAAAPGPVPPGDLGLWLTNEQVFMMRASSRCTYV
jgi:hypothetical protein